MEKILKIRWLMIAIVTLLSSIALASCSDDNKKNEKDEPETTLSVVGVWRLDFEDGYQLLTFEKNGKYSLVEFDFMSGSWSENGTYSIKGDVMTVVHSVGEVAVYTILTHTATKLILRYEGQYVGQNPHYTSDDYEDWTRVE